MYNILRSFQWYFQIDISLSTVDFVIKAYCDNSYNILMNSQKVTLVFRLTALLFWDVAKTFQKKNLS